MVVPRYRQLGKQFTIGKFRVGVPIFAFIILPDDLGACASVTYICVLRRKTAPVQLHYCTGGQDIGKLGHIYTTTQ